MKLLFVGVCVVVSPIFFFVVYEILLTSCTALITFVVFYYVAFISFFVVLVFVILRCCSVERFGRPFGAPTGIVVLPARVF